MQTDWQSVSSHVPVDLRFCLRVVQVLDTQNTIYLIMEHADKGELFDYIVSKKRVPEPEACDFFHQVEPASLVARPVTPCARATEES